MVSMYNEVQLGEHLNNEHFVVSTFHACQTTYKKLYHYTPYQTQLPPPKPAISINQLANHLINPNPRHLPVRTCPQHPPLHLETAPQVLQPSPLVSHPLHPVLLNRSRTSQLLLRRVPVSLSGPELSVPPGYPLLLHTSLSLLQSSFFLLSRHLHVFCREQHLL